MFAVLLLITLLAAVPADAACSCQCLDGAPKTLCTSVEEAAENPDLCTADPPLCPAVGTPITPQRFVAPDGAQNCRAAELWDPSEGEDASIAKVCDPARAREVDPAASLM
jgi:hypothetical protein